MEIKVGGASEALAAGLTLLLEAGIQETSRNGPVLVAPEPVMLTYTNPLDRVLLSPTRDANPFFHLFEALWMLHGGHDITVPKFFNSAYGNYSDDGTTMWDAYGWRWRRFFGWDQLQGVIDELNEHPDSRRCVVSMWQPMYNHGPTWYDCEGFDWNADLHVATHGGKAVPCNTHIYFDCRGGVLNMTVCSRSEDAIWGCFGSDVVCFSVLLEYMAARIGVPVGIYRQFSNNLHVYTDKFNLDKLNAIIRECASKQPRVSLGMRVSTDGEFDEDLNAFMVWAEYAARSTSPILMPPPSSLNSFFFAHVAVPMFNAWIARKRKLAFEAGQFVENICDNDWRQACDDWMKRRYK